MIRRAGGESLIGSTGLGYWIRLETRPIITAFYKFIWGCLVLTGYTDHRLQVETYDLFKSYKNLDADNVIYADFGKRTALAA